jgi:hypothetical protein
MPAPQSNWQGYRIALELAAPVHVGWRAVGNLKQTRPYVPGQAIWGALAARLARDVLNRNYDAAKHAVGQYLRFSYFYPSTDAERVTVWPWESRGKFDWLYLNSYMSTALREGRMAENGLLHEIEYIGANTRLGKTVYLVGYCWKSPQFEWDLKSLWGSVQLGGERTYGFGRVKQATMAPLQPGEKIFERYSTDCSDSVVLKADGEHVLLAHTGCVIEGPSDWSQVDVEPLLGRRIDEAGKFNLSPAKAAFAPGTRWSRGTSWRVQAMGMWEQVAHSQANQ